jgi:hypothetical protein
VPWRFEDIKIITNAGPLPVRARVIEATIADGSTLPVGVFRRKLEWSFTDLESGGKIMGVPDYDQAVAIAKFQEEMEAITPEQVRAARERLRNEMGSIEDA